MVVVIKQKRPPSFAIIIGTIAVLVLTILGIAVRFLKPDRDINTPAYRKSSFEEFGTFSDTLLVPVLELEISDHTLEKNWVEALTIALNGQAEVTVPYGRVDVLTSTYAIEVDYLHKFKEGIGQALHYGEVKGITPGLALIYERTTSESESDLAAKIQHIESICASKGIRLFLLKQK